MNSKLEKIFSGRGKRYNLISGSKLPTVDELEKKFKSL